MKTNIDKDGYSTITLKNDRNTYSHFGIHRLLLIAFRPVENMEELQVNHIDGNKQNNSLNNLEWCTCEQNLEHARKTGLNKVFGQKGENHVNHKLTEKDVIKILQYKKDGLSYNQILEKYPFVTKSAITSICTGRTWKSIPRD